MSSVIIWFVGFSSLGGPLAFNRSYLSAVKVSFSGFLSKMLRSTFGDPTCIKPAKIMRASLLFAVITLFMFRINLIHSPMFISKVCGTTKATNHV